MSTPTPPRRNMLPFAIAIVIVLVLAIVGTLAVTGAFNKPAPDPTTAAPSPSETDDQLADTAPTGCLGGPNRDADMLLAAQADAPQTTNGAVEVAASFTRWIQRYPLPGADEAGEVGDKLLADPSFTDDLSSYLSSAGNLSGGIVPDGQEYYMSTVPGVWQLESGSPDQAEVTIGTAFVIDGELSPQLRSSITVSLDWKDGDGWTVSDANGTRTTEELFQIGTAFTDGC